LVTAHVNRIATATPPHQVHGAFLEFARSLLVAEPRHAAIFERMADKAQIETRYSIFEPAAEHDGPAIDAAGFYRRGAFPSTGARMALFEREAPPLAEAAVRRLALGDAERARISHLVVTTCTGLSAPGIDLELVSRLGLRPSVERTVIGFMGCYAALNALKLARHIVRSEPDATVLTVNLELCTLHLQETAALEPVLSFLLFGDGCAASLISAVPEGLALDRFHTVLRPESADLITWRVGDLGFDMVLSGRVPAAISEALRAEAASVLGGADPGAIDLWAVHPGGRSVLDAVEQALALPRDALDVSRSVLRRHGNLSSATIMFVLERMLREAAPGKRGCGLAFGPGLTAETMLFHVTGG
jgi:predicted naringenin-chalcone synthase